MSDNPEQDWLLPPSIVDELSSDHLVLFVHRLVERLDLREFELEASDARRPGYLVPRSSCRQPASLLHDRSSV